MQKRLNFLWEKADALLVASPHNLRYFTGFCGGEGVALIGENTKFLFVDSRYTEAAKNEAKDFTVIEFAGGKRNEEIFLRIKEAGSKTLAFEDGEMSVQEYQGLQKAMQGIAFVGMTKELAGYRMVKTEEELSLLRKAEQIGVDAFLKVLPQIKPGVAECEIAAELEYQVRKLGAEGTSFETIVVSGVKSSMPHGKPNGKKIELGDFVTLDFGCRYGGYCSDMTRTLVVGKATEEQKKIYQTVLLAQETGLSAIKAGITGKEADTAARKVIEDAGYGKYFGHSLGHGVGLLIHEQPNLSPFSETVLEAGMVVTCEPGIYLPMFGGVRIEDMVCVTQDGIENLTHLSKELLEL